jgi:hypothetical protein
MCQHRVSASGMSPVLSRTGNFACNLIFGTDHGKIEAPITE